MACVVRAGPSCSSICGDPGRLRRVRIRSRIATASIGCVYRLAKTQRSAACARSRCSAWPARSQSAEAVSVRDQNRGGRRWRSRHRERAEAAVLVEVALPQPTALAAGLLGQRPGGDRLCRDTVSGRAACWPDPPPDLGPCHGVEVLPAARRGHDVCQALIGDGRLDERQRCTLGERVALQPGEQPIRQRPGVEWAAMRVPVRQRMQHPPLGLGHRRLGAKPHPGEQPGRVRKQLHLGQVAQRAHRQAQPEQCSAAADDHLAADRVQPELAAGVAIELDHVPADVKPPRLRVVDRRRARRRLDQVVDLISRDCNGSHAHHLTSSLPAFPRPNRPARAVRRRPR